MRVELEATVEVRVEATVDKKTRGEDSNLPPGSAPGPPSQNRKRRGNQGLRVPLSGVTYRDPGRRGGEILRRCPTSAWTVYRVTRV